MFRWFHQVKIIIVYNWVVSLLLWWIYHIKIYHFFRGHSSISQSFMMEGRRGEPNDHKGEGMSYDHTGSQWGGDHIAKIYTNTAKWSQMITRGRVCLMITLDHSGVGGIKLRKIYTNKTKIYKKTGPNTILLTEWSWKVTICKLSDLNIL